VRTAKGISTKHLSKTERCTFRILPFLFTLAVAAWPESCVPVRSQGCSCPRHGSSFETAQGVGALHLSLGSGQRVSLGGLQHLPAGTSRPSQHASGGLGLGCAALLCSLKKTTPASCRGDASRPFTADFIIL